MLQIKGKYNSALLMTDYLDEATISQLYTMMNHPAFKGEPFRIMADAHAGKGSCVGFTFKMNDYIVPNVVGVDLGCGIDGYNLGQPEMLMKEDGFERVDNFIRQNIPHGHKVRQEMSMKVETLASLHNSFTHSFLEYLVKISNKIESDLNYNYMSLGTLGGGNHFIEIDKDEDGNFWLLVHSGSRNFGLKVCNYHQDKAKKLMNKMFIGDAYKGLEFLPMDEGGIEYLDDMFIAQEFASINRDIIASDILEFITGKDIYVDEVVKTTHNYVNDDDRIIRKGAIQANKGQKVLIPLNMRDGVIVGTGKGDKTWNNSAPHGAGRKLSRKQAKEKLSLDVYKKQMDGIFTTSVSEKTKDEAPDAYKDKNEIIEAVKLVADIDFIMKPVYNFKAN